MPLSWLALGDSYTIGEGVAESGRWPLQLAAALRAEGIDLAEPQLIAQTGWTTDELDAAISAQAPAGHFDLVSLLIGVNNQYRGYPLEAYRSEFEALLQRAAGFARTGMDGVIVLSIPDWGVTPFARRELVSARRVGAQIDAFNAVARDICAAHGVAFVDVTPVSRARGAEPAMLADDGLHPSAAMYAEWAALALPAARAALT